MQEPNVVRYRDTIDILDPPPQQDGGELLQNNDIQLTDKILELEDQLGQSESPGDGEAFDFIEAKALAGATMSFRAEVPGVKATASAQMLNNPLDGDRIIVRTYFDDAGVSISGIGGAEVRVDFKAVLGLAWIPSIAAGTAVLDVRIEATIAGTMANLVGGLNDPLLLGTGPPFVTSFPATWTASATGGGADTLRMEQDFAGTMPNNQQAIRESIGNVFGGGGNFTTTYVDGSNTVPEQVTSRLFDIFLFETAAGAIRLLLNGKLKSGTHEPESFPTSSDIALADPSDIVFDDGPDGERRIEIFPTKNASVGVVTIEWFWNGKRFTAEITKIVL